MVKTVTYGIPIIPTMITFKLLEPYAGKYPVIMIVCMMIVYSFVFYYNVHLFDKEFRIFLKNKK